MTEYMTNADAGHMQDAIKAANAEIQAYWSARPCAPFQWDMSVPISGQIEKSSAAVRAHRAAFPKAEIEAIWRKHGFVPAENALGHRFQGAA
jgi:hypothetical protein